MNADQRAILAMLRKHARSDMDDREYDRDMTFDTVPQGSVCAHCYHTVRRRDCKHTSAPAYESRCCKCDRLR